MRTLTHDERLRRRIETAASKVGSVNKLARAANVAQSSLSRWLRFRCGLSWKNVEKILNYLGQLDCSTGVSRPGGFKPLNGQTKREKLHIRVNHEERQAIETRAAEAGKPVSTFVRDILLSPELDLAIRISRGELTAIDAGQFRRVDV